MDHRDCGTCARGATAGAGEMSRRTFFIQGSLAAVSIVLVACSAGGPTAPGRVSLTIALADYPALATVGGVAYVNASGNPLAIVRTGTSTFVTVSRICPHQGGTVNAISGGFLCPNHGAQFNDQGTWVGGQPTGNLTTYNTQYDAGAQTLSIS